MLWRLAAAAASTKAWNGVLLPVDSASRLGPAFESMSAMLRLGDSSGTVCDNLIGDPALALWRPLLRRLAFECGVPVRLWRELPFVSMSSFTHIAAHATSNFSRTTASRAGLSFDSEGVESAAACNARTAFTDLVRTKSTEFMDMSPPCGIEHVLIVAQLSEASSGQPEPLQLRRVCGVQVADGLNPSPQASWAQDAEDEMVRSRFASKGDAAAFGFALQLRRCRGTGCFLARCLGLEDCELPSGSTALRPARRRGDPRPMSASSCSRRQSCTKKELRDGGADEPRFSAGKVRRWQVLSISAPNPLSGCPAMLSKRVQLPTGGERCRLPAITARSAPRPCLGMPPCNSSLLVGLRGGGASSKRFFPQLQESSA